MISKDHIPSQKHFFRIYAHPHSHIPIISPVSLRSCMFPLKRSRALLVEDLMCSLRDLWRSSKRMDLDIFPVAFRFSSSSVSPLSMSGLACSAAVCIREFLLQCSLSSSPVLLCVCAYVCACGTQWFLIQASVPAQCEYFKKPHLCNLSALSCSCVSFKPLLVFTLSVCILNI